MGTLGRGVMGVERKTKKQLESELATLQQQVITAHS